MLRKWLFALQLRIFGLRFYRTGLVPKSQEFKKAVFETVNGKTVEFFLYKEECEDLVYRFGRITKSKFTGYVVQARLDASFPPKIVQFNNMKFFFHVNFIRDLTEEEVGHALVMAYIKFLKAELAAQARDPLGPFSASAADSDQAS
jgi:hypothetical protein